MSYLCAMCSRWIYLNLLRGVLNRTHVGGVSPVKRHLWDEKPRSVENDICGAAFFEREAIPSRKDSFFHTDAEGNHADKRSGVGYQHYPHAYSY